MERKFNEKKTIQVAALLLKKRGGEMGLLDFTKLVYLVDRAALVQWGISVTGDRYASMKRGMVLSETYDLSKRKFVQKRLWDEYISAPDHNHKMRLLQEPDIDELSENEIELVDKIYEMFGSETTSYLIERVHHRLPEWVDVGNSSMIVSYESVLEKNGWKEEQIKEFLDEMEASSYFEQYCV